MKAANTGAQPFVFDGKSGLVGTLLAVSPPHSPKAFIKHRKKLQGVKSEGICCFSASHFDNDDTVEKLQETRPAGAVCSEPHRAELRLRSSQRSEFRSENGFTCSSVAGA